MQTQSLSLLDGYLSPAELAGELKSLHEDAGPMASIRQRTPDNQDRPENLLLARGCYRMAAGARAAKQFA
jgi:hypothetical protein